MDNLELKEKLQLLYEDLKKEVDGTTTSTGVFLPPSSGSFYLKAKKLVDEAICYSKIDNSFAIENILHTFGKEVSYVKDYVGKGKTHKKQQKELETLMRNATHQLYIDLCPLIKE